MGPPSPDGVQYEEPGPSRSAQLNAPLKMGTARHIILSSAILARLVAENGCPYVFPSAIRSGPWRLVEFHEDSNVELYNLADDLGEQHDLAATMPEKVTKLRTKLHAWRERVRAQMPTPNPAFDPARASNVGDRAGD